MDITGQIPEILSKLCADIAPLFPGETLQPILFGSYARGDTKYGSDLDVLILVDASRQEIADRQRAVANVAGDLLVEHGIPISPIVENRAFYHHWLPVLPFFQNIQREGIPIPV